MNYLLKLVAAVPAMLTASLGFYKTTGADTILRVTEESAWDAAASNSNSDAMAQFISQFPQSARAADALDLVIQNEIDALHSSGGGQQLAQANFGDFGGEGPY